MEHTTQIKIKALSKTEADNKAKHVEQIANNLDEAALQILAQKSAKPGMSDKVRQFAGYM
jgi:hypothetical protein